MDEAKKILLSELGDNLKIVEPLAKYTTLGIGGAADFFWEAKSGDDLVKAVEAAKKARVQYFILGGGSSVLVSDVGFHGLVIRNQFEGIKESPTEMPGKVEVEVASGTSLAKLVRYSVENNFSGLEGLAGQPGSVGGAIVWNCGTNGDRISSHLTTLNILDIIGARRVVPKNDCQFDYMTSRFLGRPEVIISAKFALMRSDAGTVQANINQAMAKRSDKPKEPRVIEAFKYLSGESPERFITAVGLAGHKIGGAQIMPLSANHIQNLGQATSENVLELVELAKSKVEVKYYTSLQPSWLYLGPS